MSTNLRYRFRPMATNARTYHVIVPGIGALGIVAPGAAGKGWIPVSLTAGVALSGTHRTREQAARALAAGVAARAAARAGRGKRSRKVAA